MIHTIARIGVKYVLGIYLNTVKLSDEQSILRGLLRTAHLVLIILL